MTAFCVDIMDVVLKWLNSDVLELLEGKSKPGHRVKILRSRFEACFFGIIYPITTIVEKRYLGRQETFGRIRCDNKERLTDCLCIWMSTINIHTVLLSQIPPELNRH